MTTRLSATPARPRPSLYITVLNWSFALFNSSRLLTYLPTIWAIHASGRSDQHSLITWMAWTGANFTMALWLYEQSGRRVDGAIVVNFCNAAMCLLTCLVIACYRF